MKTQSDSGIRIENQKTNQMPVTDILIKRVIPGAVSFAVIGGGLAYAFDIAEKISLLPGLFVGIAVCLLPLFNKTRLADFKYILALLAVLVLTVCFKSRVSDGVCIAYNGWCGLLTKATGIMKTGLEVNSNGTGENVSLIIFSVCSAGLLAIGSVNLTRFRGALPVLCLCLATCSILLLREQASPFWTFVLLAWGALILALQTVPDGEDFFSRVLLNAGAVIAGVAAIFAICMAIPYLNSGSAFQDVKESLDGGIHRLMYEPSESNLPEGDFTSLGGKTSSGGEMLKVTAKKAETMYLRGFVGESYTGTGWKPIENETLAENGELIYWLHRQGFYPQTQTAAVSKLLENEVDIESSRITVENTAACGKYMYVPYSVTLDSCEDYITLEKLNPDGITAASSDRKAKTYTVISNAGEIAQDILTALNNLDKSATEAYLLAEAGYREFVQKYYLDVPDNIEELFASVSDKPVDNTDPNVAIVWVQNFLENMMEYNEDTDVFPGDTDFAQWTLNQGEGYDVHYATITVLALRYCGIPARYAEGYIVDGRNISSAENEVISVDDSAAHAWAEIYQEGIGWVPLDLTPGFENAGGSVPQAGEDTIYVSNTEDPDSEIGTVQGEGEGTFSGSDSEYDLQQEQSAEENEEDGQTPEDAPTSRTKVSVMLRKSLPRLLLIIPAFVIAMIIRRALILKRREKKFSGKRTKDAISWSFAYAAAVLKTIGLDRKNGSMTVLLPAVCETLGETYRDSFAAMCDLNGEALFSGHVLTKNSREQMDEFRKNTLSLVKQKTGFFKKLKYTWLKCLY